MMDSLNHRNADYIRDVSMEISSAFFPPPNIVLPSMTLPPLNNFRYDFKTEHQMIQKYKEEQERIKQISELEGKDETELKNRREELMAAAEQATSDSPCSSCSTPPSVEFSSSNENSKPNKNIVDKNVYSSLPSVLTATNLNSWPAYMNSNQAKPCNQLEPSKPGKEIRKLQRFEEFEVAASIFDVLELRSLDDRKELEKLLNGL